MSIGIVVMFLVGTIIGIQFLVASAEDKAKVKEALIHISESINEVMAFFSKIISDSSKMKSSHPIASRQL